MAQSRVAATPVDPRQDGWPCRGAHQSGREKNNQYARWTSCKTCGLRLSYVVKTKGHGESRSVGPAPELVAMAQEELQQVYQPVEMNEKIFMGKVMEIKGRSLVMQRGQGSLQVEIRADQPRGRNLLGEAAPTTGYQRRSQSTTATTTPMPTTPTPAPQTPTRSTRATRSVSPTPSFAPSEAAVPVVNPMAKAKVKAAPVPEAPMRVLPDANEVLVIHSDEEALEVES